MNREEYEKLFIETDLGIFTPEYDGEYFNETGLYKVIKDAQTCYYEEISRRKALEDTTE